MKIFFPLFLAIVGLSGCATVIKTPGQSVAVRSVPAGAKVLTSNGKSGVTPFSFRASRKENCRVTISKEGYQPVSVNLISRPSTTGKIASGGNALIGGIVGTVVDQATGSTLELQPDPVLVRLSLLSSPTPSIVLSRGSKLTESQSFAPSNRTPTKIPKKRPAVNSRPNSEATDVHGTEYL